MQIIQFVIDLHLVYFGSTCPSFASEQQFTILAAYQHFVANYYQHLPHMGDCQGAESSAIFGCALLSSYLLLFVDFYFRTYKKPVKGSKSNGSAKVNGKVNGKAYVVCETSLLVEC